MTSAGTRLLITNLLDDFKEIPDYLGSSFTIPKRSFGKTYVVEKSFQQCWSTKWPFLSHLVFATRI